MPCSARNDYRADRHRPGRRRIRIHRKIAQRYDKEWLVISTIILASKSPRRQQLLSQIGLRNVRVIPSGIDEEEFRDLPPAELVSELSRRKAEAVSGRAGPEDIVIAADTVVVFDGTVLGKPEDDTDAFKMLTMLSGSWHTVYTGVTVSRGKETLTAYEQTDVRFRELDSDEIEAYVETGEPEDKAGAYGIQEMGAVFVERIEGDCSNVIGLPLCLLYKLLSRLGCRILGRNGD